MEQKTYKKYVIGIGSAVGIVVGYAAVRGNIVLAAVAVVTGMLFLYLCKTRVTGVIEDERAYRISEKASRRTVQIIGVSSAVSGLGMIGLSRAGYMEMEQVGFALAYYATVLLAVYMLFYWYYSNQYGG
jgi:uncharacterized membrane protein